jgi:hypothetical protein
MPVYHMTTPDSESEYSDTPLENYVPASGLSLAAVVNRTSVTDKWLDDVVKYTLAGEIPERTKRLNVRRHRVFRTSVESHSRTSLDSQIRAHGDSQSKDQSPTTKDIKKDEEGVEDPSSWIAAEIFGIAKAQASAEDITKPRYKNSDEIQSIGQDERYDDIESLIDDYFDDVKIAGSDSDDD